MYGGHWTLRREAVGRCSGKEREGVEDDSVGNEDDGVGNEDEVATVERCQTVGDDEGNQ
jgi:hypothetical protein